MLKLYKDVFHESIEKAIRNSRYRRDSIVLRYGKFLSAHFLSSIKDRVNHWLEAF